MKKLQSLGRSLSKEEQRKIKGGDEELEGCGRCTYAVGNTTYIYSCNTFTFEYNGKTYSGCVCSNTNGGSCS